MYGDHRDSHGLTHSFPTRRSSDLNTCKTRSLLQSCVDQGITRFVFSSTAAVYGEPDEVPVGEAAPTRPASPYGASKLMVEWMLRDVDRAHGLDRKSTRLNSSH